MVTACNEEQVGKPHPKDLIRWPVDISADPTGQYLFVVNSNFDQLYLGGSIAVMDLTEEKVLEEGTARVSGFCGVLMQRLSADGSLEDLYVASRLGDEIHQIEVGVSSDGVPLLSCHESESANACDEAHSSPLTSELGFDVEPYAGTFIPTQDGRGILVTAGLADGYLYTFEVSAEGSVSALSNIRIGSGVQAIQYDPATSRLLFVHRSFPLLTTVEVAFGEIEGVLDLQLGEPRTLALPSVSNIFDFGRDLAVNPVNGQIAISWRSPSSVLILEADESLTSGYKLVRQIGVGNGAAGLNFAPFGPNGEMRLFVSAFKEDKMYVLDPVSGTVLQILSLPNGPYATTVINDSVGDRKWIVSANFEANNISVIEGDAAKEGYMQVIKEFPIGEE